MAWNEPGNNGDKNDPWKNRGKKEQGPPDLDKVFQDLADKVSGIFGGKPKPAGSGSSGGAGGKLGMGIVIAILVIVWFFSGLYTIKEAERAIVLRFGEYHGLEEPGLSWKPTFIDTVEVVDIKAINSLAAGGDMLTKDENVVRVEFMVQYRVIDPRNYKYSVTNADDSLSQATDSALRYVVGHSLMGDVLTSGREKVRQDTREAMQRIIDPYNLGLEIVDVNFKDARPPEEVKDAFDDAIAAQEDEERFIKEAEAYARELEPRARGQVKRMEQEANAYGQRVVLEAEGKVASFAKLLPEYQNAPEVTRQRLYLDAMEQVYSSTSKVLVDVEGGGNMMYLPLDKIMQQQNMNLPLSSGKNTVQSLRDQRSGSIYPQPSVGIRGERSRGGRN
ncbi:MAG: FtsH protease activity modulator HflK [Algicola sp.]|nr:FtsH protease activity modulator HflK [Algicola sp.]